MIKSCGNTTVAIYMGIFLFLLLVMCVIGCFWHWKRQNTRKFTLPTILQLERRRKPFSNSRIIKPKQKILVETEVYIDANGENKVEGNYENVNVRSFKTEEEKDDKLYENSQQPNFEEHIYGNETQTEYCNFQKTNASEDCQDEDIYILPDA